MPDCRLLRRCLTGLMAGLLTMGLTVAGQATPAASIDLTLHASGSVTDDIQVRRSVDDTHFCALAGRPDREQTLVLAFNTRPTDALLGTSDFGFSLSIAGRAGGTWDETHPSTIMQVSIGSRLFIGLPAANPDFHLQVSADAGGREGRFNASHLVDQAGTAAIDVAGTWRCARKTAPAGGSQESAAASAAPAVTAAAAETGEQETELAARVLAPPPPVPAKVRKPGQFRIYHSEGCQGPSCRSWTATDLRSGKTSRATVDFSHLKVAAALLAPAQSGEIELWITGEELHDRRHGLVITAQRLDGTVSRHSETFLERFLAGH